MSGLNISCGSFHGADKSGSAFAGVIEALSHAPASLRKNIMAGFEAGEYTLISTEQAAQLLPHLVAYRAELVDTIGHADWLQEAAAEDAATPGQAVDHKWGKGRGWRLYCLTDLIQACQVSQQASCPVLVAVD